MRHDVRGHIGAQAQAAGARPGAAQVGPEANFGVATLAVVDLTLVVERRDHRSRAEQQVDITEWLTSPYRDANAGRRAGRLSAIEIEVLQLEHEIDAKLPAIELER